jgi:hypothetical protein
MNIQEIQEQLQDNQEITINLDSRVRELEERKVIFPEMKVPDYTVHFKEIKEMLEQKRQSLYQEVQTELIDNLVAKLAHKLPEKTKTVMRHHFDNSAKSLFTGGIILILTTAAAVGFAVTFWRENQRLHDVDVKFRMIKQQYPSTALWADTTYYKNPRVAEEVTERLEVEKVFKPKKLK